MKSSDSMYQNLQFKDKDPNSTVDELKSAGDTSTSKDVQVLQKKLRIWRIVTTILLMFIILAVIIAITIFYMKGKKQNTGEAELQKLKANICIANVLLELLQNTMLQGGVEAKKHPDTTCKYCASNWIHHSGSCYFFSTALMNWTESRDSCRRMNSQFVKIQSQDKQTFVAVTANGPTWIGLSKNKDDLWIWEDGTTLKEGEGFWNPNEPNNLAEIENCAELLSVNINSTGWNDTPCSSYKHSICQRLADTFQV
ncbi:CD209 antigen-like protein C isoform X1 [Ambystoma mexicanum]|uniref:CD209 antigen-like protein C isoform X1 n=1 Tax=Ambystoma mexicanum TaxID=8296 RepID=UPI0037E74B1F